MSQTKLAPQIQKTMETNNQTNGAFVDRSRFFDFTDYKTSTVHVAELGGNVLVREMDAGTRAKHEASYIAVYKFDDIDEILRTYSSFKINVVVACTLDPLTKVALFSPNDVPQLMRLPFNIIETIYNEIASISNLSKEDQANVKKLSETIT